MSIYALVKFMLMGCFWPSSLVHGRCWPSALKDEAGEEGVAVFDQPEGQKKLVVGSRFAVEKTKAQSHETKEDQDESFEKLKSKMMGVNAVSKACCLGVCCQPCLCPRLRTGHSQVDGLLEDSPALI